MQFICDIQTPWGMDKHFTCSRVHMFTVFTVPSVDRLRGGAGRARSSKEWSEQTGSGQALDSPSLTQRVALLTSFWAVEHLPECWLSKVGEAGSGWGTAIVATATLRAGG